MKSPQSPSPTWERCSSDLAMSVPNTDDVHGMSRLSWPHRCASHDTATVRGQPVSLASSSSTSRWTVAQSKDSVARWGAQVLPLTVLLCSDE